MRNCATPTAAMSSPTLIVPATASRPATKATSARNSPLISMFAPSRALLDVAARSVAASDSALTVA